MYMYVCMYIYIYARMIDNRLIYSDIKCQEYTQDHSDQGCNGSISGCFPASQPKFSALVAMQINHHYHTLTPSKKVQGIGWEPP